MTNNRTQPNPIDTEKYHANRIGQGVRPRKCSTNPARERYYAAARTERFARRFS